jgi:hypothetical protein
MWRWFVTAGTLLVLHGCATTTATTTATSISTSTATTSGTTSETTTPTTPDVVSTRLGLVVEFTPKLAQKDIARAVATIETAVLAENYTCDNRDVTCDTTWVYTQQDVATTDDGMSVFHVYFATPADTASLIKLSQISYAFQTSPEGAHVAGRALSVSQDAVESRPTRVWHDGLAGGMMGLIVVVSSAINGY